MNSMLIYFVVKIDFSFLLQVLYRPAVFRYFLKSR
jgi:hypothetical protein